MIIMRNWRSDSVAAVPISNFNGVSAKISDPQEGTSKQYESSIRSIYPEPIKKSPSTPECEEVLAELRKKYCNPKENTSKQFETHSNFNYKLSSSTTSPTLQQVVDISTHAKLLHGIYNKRFSPNNPKCSETAQSAMELLRSCIQYAFDQEVDLIVKKFLQVYFVPALQNLKNQQNEISIPDDILCDVCCSLLDKSKEQYLGQAQTSLESSMSPLSTATTPKMELSETESESSIGNISFAMNSTVKMESDSAEDASSPFTEEEMMDQDITDDLLGKIAEEISEEDLSQAFSFEDSLLSDIPCISLSPPPVMDALISNDFKVPPLPPISTITSSLSKPYAPFSSLFGSTAESCLDFIDLDFE